MRITEEITGLEEMVQNLDQFYYGLPPELEKDLKEAGQPIVTALQTYPPTRPGSPYVRTFKYEQSIQSAADLVGNTAYFAAWSTVDYERYLRGDFEGYQGAWMHRGRWRTLTDIRDFYVPIVIAQIKDKVQAFIRKWGLNLG